MIKSLSAPDIRDRNYRIVFNLARRQGELLRPDISKQTGMTPPTVLKMVQAFVAKGLLVEAGEADTSLGRKPMRLRFNPQAAMAVGILFEGGEMHAALSDLSGNLTGNIRIPMEHSFNDATVPVIINTITRLLDGVQAPILGVGLGVPGVVDGETNVIRFAPLIGISSPMDCSGIIKAITARTGLPVRMENDVNAAAAGEFVCRKLNEDEDLLYIAVGTGIGAGIIINGKLRRGSRNLAGELGYAVQNSSYVVDYARQGWLEGQIGMDALRRRFQWRGYEQGEADLPEGLIDYLVGHLAPVVANLATQLDIGLVVLGGLALDSLGDPLYQALAQKISQLSLEPGICERSVSSDPGVVGAAMQIIEIQLDTWLTDQRDRYPTTL